MFSGLKNQRGFILIELLVVVIILAVLAAMVIPRLRSSSQDAKESALDTDLSALRSAIELYYYDHNKVYPAVIKTHTTIISGGGNTSSNSSSHASAEDAFIKQLTYCSDINGNTSNTCDATYEFGPYLKRGIPKNPLPNSATTTDAQAAEVNVDTLTATLETATASDLVAKGWFFVQQTGEFFANNTDHDER